MFHDFIKIDFKGKLLALAAVGAWAVSIYFSKNGFSIESPNMVWLGWCLGLFVTAVELAFNDKTRKMTVTIVIAGLLCYGYGVWTNVIGFWGASHPGEVFVPLSQASIMAWFVGLVLEILPEPLLMFSLGRGRESDPLGVISDLLKGVTSIDGDGGKSNNNQNQSKPQHQDRPAQPHFDAQRKPEYRQQGGGDLKGLADEIFKTQSQKSTYRPMHKPSNDSHKYKGE